jgi:hypothetical protein
MGGEALRNRLSAVCRPLVPLLSFFIPAMKLASKVKTGSREIKRYDAPRSPFRRLLEPEASPSEIKAEPARLRGLYNPARLQHNVNKAVLALREAVAALFPFSGRESAA